jgi:hypothetical protein
LSRLATYRYAIAAGRGETVHFDGDALRIIAADGAVDVRLDDDPAARLYQGIAVRVRDRPFRKVRIENPGGAVLNVEFTLASGDVDDSRASFADAIPVGSSPVLDTGPDVSVPAGGTALVLASNPKRREVIVQNRSVNAREVRIGDSGAAASEGIELQPGETLRLNVTADIYAYNPHTAAAVLAVQSIRGA